MLKKTNRPKKVFISVDMEGVCGVIRWDEVSASQPEYGHFRKLMTQEANAAIQGALDAGAEQIFVRDAHGTACNLLPDELHERAILIRGWSGGPLMMMEGIDESFDAAIFVGYHARIGSENGILQHTITRRLYNVSLNGRPVPELGINAAIAGYFRVPVVFVSGDRAIIEQAKELLGMREYVTVKEGVGKAAKNIHPHLARKFIREGVRRALERFDQFDPYLPERPFRFTLDFVEEEAAIRTALIPGAKQTGPRTVEFVSAEWMEALRFFALATYLAHHIR